MNADESELHSTADSNVSISLCDASSTTNLNNNVNFSVMENSSVNASDDLLMLSVTLDPEEREELELQKQKEELSGNHLHASLESAVSVHVNSTSNAEITHQNGHTSSEDITMDENVIPIEVEQSTLQSASLENTVESQALYVENRISLERDFFQRPLVELGRKLWKSDMQAQHYTKGCLWSPDGTCILVPVALDGMHVFELPRDLYELDTLSTKRPVSELSSAVYIKEGGTVYDVVWYPMMNSGTPTTCCWLSTRQHEPVHMWDAFTGELRCSYRGYDDVDEVETAISLVFSNDGEKIVAGYKKSIKIFDTNNPGRDYTSVPVKQSASCFAFCSDYRDTITAGSWDTHIRHYDLRSPKLGPLFTLGGHTGGITWLRYVSSIEHGMLFSGARKDNNILQWDMRNYKKPVREFTRSVNTNQRIYFDLSPLQQWLVSGGTDGRLRIWDLQGEFDESLPLHNDCCNGVNFHPVYPILATTSGQYHFVDVTQNTPTATEAEDVDKIVNYENSLLLLWLGNSRDGEDC